MGVLQLLEGSSLAYPLWGLLLLVVSLWLVPRRDYQYLLPHGMMAGIVAVAVVTFFDKVLGAFIYVQAFPYTIGNVPLFLALGWGAVIIMFLWGLPEKDSRWLHGTYIAAFVLAGIGPETMFHQLGLRPYASWFSNWMGVFHISIIFLLNYLTYRWRQKSDPKRAL